MQENVTGELTAYHCITQQELLCGKALENGTYNQNRPRKSSIRELDVCRGLNILKFDKHF